MTALTTKSKKAQQVELLGILQSQTQFAELPVVWQPSRTGPKMRVKGVMWGAVTIEVNFKAVSMGTLLELIPRALKDANDIHRGLTQASAVGVHETEVHEGREYVPNERDVMISAWQALEAWADEEVN